MDFPLDMKNLQNVNLLEYSATMRHVAHDYYHEAFVDTLSIFINWVSITLLFDNIRVFSYFWNTLKYMYGLVNLSVFYFFILSAGLAFANMAFNISYDQTYLSYTNSFAQTLIPFGNSYKQN